MAKIKVGDVWPPPYFLLVVIGVWLVLQGGILAMMCWRRRQAARLSSKQE